MPEQNIDTLLELAKTASAANNAEQAEKYYTQILEIDPKNSEAWFEKGKAVSLLSSLNNIPVRINETITYFKKSIDNSTEDKKDETVEKCLTELNNLVTDFYVLSNKHLNEFVTLPNSYEDFIKRVISLTVALEQASEWNPKNKIILDNIMYMCVALIEGVEYKDPSENNISKVWILTPEFEKIVRDKISATSDKIKKINPEYVAPNPTPKKPEESNCFVITATMGNPNHPNVVLLREFRDSWLSHRKYGNRIITLYYKYGPIIAEYIRNNYYLRKISYYFIVKPAVFLVKRMMK